MLVILLGILFLAIPVTSSADIYEPEGLNMPGGWNGWGNPPSNLAIASYTQVAGGRVTKISNGITRWQTIFSVGASGADLVGGTYNWLFTSGSTGNPWGNKWAGVNVSMNTLQSYTFNSGPDNSITINNGKWYTMNWKDSGYTGTQAIFMETSAQPVNILSVTVPILASAGLPVNVSVEVSGTMSAEEILYVRYSTDNWVSSHLLAATMNGATGTVEIPAQTDGVTVSCYAFTSTVANITADYDLYSIRKNNNSGSNYSYAVGAAPISWANIQTPGTALINPGETVDVYAQVYVAGSTGQPAATAGIQGWIGYSTSNTNPNTWVDWVPATYVGPSALNDEYKAAIGTGLAPGTYYYASRFQLNAGAYVYGGFSSGIWNGTTNISGVLTVNGAAPAVTTGTVLNVGASTAQVSGTVVSDGGAPVTSRGICWSISPSPTIADYYTSEGTGVGSFTSTLPSLDAGTLYYARAYATNVNGTNYGDEVQFTTLYNVYLNVDMSTAAGFVPGVDLVYVAGSFPGAFWNTPGSNNNLQLSQVGTSLIYSLTLSLPAGSYDYKYFKNAGWSGGEWGGGPDRSVSFTGNTTFNDTWGGSISWVNVQSPATGTILPATTFAVNALATIPNGITGGTGGAYGLLCWIGYSTSNTDPSTWTNWVPATYLGNSGINDEFQAEIGTSITSTGTYYYASRFKFGQGSYVYGGYNSGYWDGSINISGVLSVVNGFNLAVTTGLVSDITGSTASVTGNVIADGGNPVITRGICWSTDVNPTVDDNITSDGSGLGAFTGALTALLPGSTYYARAYAINSTDTVYGTQVSFMTLYSVRFKVDMNTASGFIPGTDIVYIAGGFPGALWNEPGTNPTLALAPVPGDEMTYSIELFLPAGNYEYKYFLNASWAGGEWTAGGNRSCLVNANSIISNTWGGELAWVNLQWPDAGTIESGTAYMVYAKANIPNGKTGGTSQAYGLQAWIGYSTSDTDPSTWTNWVPATFNGPADGNDEFVADLGTLITTPGTYYYASRFKLGSGSETYGGYSATNGGFWDGTNNVSGILTVNPAATKTLNINLFLEGLYNSGLGVMNQAIDIPPSPKFGAGVADLVTVELHDAVTYATAYTYTDIELLTDGTLSIGTIPGSLSDAYFIVIKHRNSLETWSATAISFSGSGPLTYDFTTDASVAYGNNMKQVGSAWVIFGGDVSQDGIVDGTDMALIDNASTAVLQGYYVEDANGDGVVDGSDMAMIDNNSTAIVQLLRP
jgi:hypothetical protein